ncbi:lipoteichoic acid synthase LtaS type IIIa [Sporolactobacillus inulinus]|uniref:Lipoteichoic acid synthase LtaS type IIIa n=1 Tax=Sporolactobacillus inulinus TaxID=2078 RepID=A0A4Y1ZIZ4_9BACL|nr:lipoteichoic acid synthase LtaS type IIIa [Sporolactobacillus inulinus]
MLDYSDKVIYGDLLRFYTPKGFVAPDVSKINYNTDQKSHRIQVIQVSTQRTMVLMINK